jgi:hypothetical protein
MNWHEALAWYLFTCCLIILFFQGIPENDYCEGGEGEK